ncbi:unnamed protein product, partial [Amoebophrya sp. A25]|eukprot:GSA25T00026951001.1
MVEEPQQPSHYVVDVLLEYRQNGDLAVPLVDGGVDPSLQFSNEGKNYRAIYYNIENLFDSEILREKHQVMYLTDARRERDCSDLQDNANENIVDSAPAPAKSPSKSPPAFMSPREVGTLNGEAAQLFRRAEGSERVERRIVNQQNGNPVEGARGVWRALPAWTPVPYEVAQGLGVPTYPNAPTGKSPAISSGVNAAVTQMAAAIDRQSNLQASSPQAGDAGTTIGSSTQASDNDVTSVATLEVLATSSHAVTSGQEQATITENKSAVLVNNGGATPPLTETEREVVQLSSGLPVERVVTVFTTTLQNALNASEGRGGQLTTIARESHQLPHSGNMYVRRVDAERYHADGIVISMEGSNGNWSRVVPAQLAWVQQRVLELRLSVEQPVTQEQAVGGGEQ